METLIGTIGFIDPSTGRSVIHPDYNFQHLGLNVPVSAETASASGMDLYAGQRITCVVAGPGQPASEIKQYDGTGIAA